MPEEPTSADQRGQVLSEIANGIVGLHARHYGRGPTRARAFLREEHALCILEDIFTTAEQTLIGSGNATRVREARLAFQEAMSDEFIRIVEDATGRKVRAFLSQVQWEPDVAAELFLFEPTEEDGGSGGAADVPAADEPGDPD